MAEELETVLRLVAEGHLTPEQAAPIIEALTRVERRPDDDPDEPGAHVDEPFHAFEHLDRLGERIQHRIGRQIQRASRRAETSAARAAARAADVGHGRQLRIRITEHGRQVVNLRIPIGFVDTALRVVPGLGGDQAQRIRDAVRAGAVGPILDVEDPDGEGGVLISVE